MYLVLSDLIHRQLNAIVVTHELYEPLVKLVKQLTTVVISAHAQPDVQWGISALEEDVLAVVCVHQ
jgi:hypothetical protein